MRRPRAPVLTFVVMYNKVCGLDVYNQWHAVSSSELLKIIQILRYERYLNLGAMIIRALVYRAQFITISELHFRYFDIFCANMGRQKPYKSKHRLYTSHSASTSTSRGPATSGEDGNSAAGSEQYSCRNSVAVSGRTEDHLSECTSSRGARSPGLNVTPQSARPLIPTRPATSTPTGAGRENILAPLDLTPVNQAASLPTANASGNGGSSSVAVMEQLKQFFATQAEFNKKLEQRLEELKGRENRTKEVMRPTKDLSVSR